ncbi:hypothetical protein GN958_ATG12631 [Phytophthora infestans]|uniref:Uncharacterized protein n=1 Tax=Phytophthora infestans TaxID=4787 RepID=A0A8S9UBZ4_PHYIN|nr:hypothetical protein GN958_ATG12631 [Phytophthora infestans]
MSDKATLADLYVSGQHTCSIKSTSSSYATLLCESEQCADASLHAERYQDAQLSQLTVASATESATEYPDNTTAAATTTAPKDHCDYKSQHVYNYADFYFDFSYPHDIDVDEGGCPGVPWPYKHLQAVLSATSVSNSAVVQPERHPEQHALYELT